MEKKLRVINRWAIYNDLMTRLSWYGNVSIAYALESLMYHFFEEVYVQYNDISDDNFVLMDRNTLFNMIDDQFPELEMFNLRDVGYEEYGLNITILAFAVEMIVSEALEKQNQTNNSK